MLNVVLLFSDWEWFFWQNVHLGTVLSGAIPLLGTVLKRGMRKIPSEKNSLGGRNKI